MSGMSEHGGHDGESLRRTRRFPSPPGRATIDDDRAVDVGWYDEHKVDGERVYLERFGRIPAPATLSDFIRTVQHIAAASNGQIYGWRGQSDGSWGIHSGGMRRVMQPWVKPFPADEERHRQLFADIREQLGAPVAKRREARGDDEWQLWWDMLTYHGYLLDEARLRGFDHHEGVQLCDLELLALLQHNGAATHLLDLSRDVTTALWFASSDPNHADKIGVVAAFDETGIGHLRATAAKSMEFHELMYALQYPDTISTKPAVGWIPRSLTDRILAQRGLFILSSYADQPWGSVQVTGTYVWQGDIDENLVEPNKPRAFFVAIRPELKKEVFEAGRSGLLGVDPTSLFPDIVGFASANRSTQELPLAP
jgi:hypothetical protein